MITLDDQEVAFPVHYIDCRECRHYLLNHECKAFPGGIPQGIINGKSHRGPHKGDNGIRFDPVART